MRVESRHGLDELRRLARMEREAGMRVDVQAIVRTVQSHPSTEIARALDVGTRSVQEWVRRYNRGGVDAPRRRSGQGRPYWLSTDQRARLCDRIDAGEQGRTEDRASEERSPDGSLLPGGIAQRCDQRGAGRCRVETPQTPAAACRCADPMAPPRCCAPSVAPNRRMVRWLHARTNADRCRSATLT